MEAFKLNVSTLKYPDTFTIVDECDFESLSKMNWRMHKRGYPRLATWVNKKTKHVTLHRFILGVTDPTILVDHINGNTLDNRRSNLRTCTRKQNNQNRRADVLNQSGFRGVCFDKRAKKWKAEISSDSKRMFLGHFENPEDAAAAYNTAAKECFGDFAYLNKVSA